MDSSSNKDCVILDDIIPAIYHYLDGNISDEYGSNAQSIVNIMKDLINPVIDGYLKTREVGILAGMRPFEGDKRYIYTVADYLSNCWRSMKDVEKILEADNKDLIIIASTYLHGVAIYISKVITGYDTNAYHVVFVNTGSGIDKHHKYLDEKGVDNRVYNLWKSYIFKDLYYRGYGYLEDNKKDALVSLLQISYYFKDFL